MPRNRRGEVTGGDIQLPRAPRRRRITARWAATAGLLLVTWAGSGAPLRALPHESEVWIRADTAHFILFSNVSPDYTREIAHQLELFRRVLGGLNPDLEMNSPLPAYVFVFRNAQSLNPYRARFGTSPTALDGYFCADRDANYIALNATPDDDWFAPVYHEFVHYLVNNNFGDVPLWFNEGLAEYYSTFRLTTEGAIEIGREVQSAADWLRRNRMMPLTRLFEIAVGSPEYNEVERQGRYYSQSWALVHYLMWGEPGWRNNLSDRVARLDAGEELISLVPMDSYADLEKGFDRYVKTARYRSTLVEVGVAGADDRARITSLDRAEILYRLGDLLARIDSGKEAEAEKHFRESIRLNPSHAASHAGLGLLRDRDGRHEGATPYYEMALALDPDDGMIAFLYATNLRILALGEDESRTPILDTPPGDLLRARELYRRSLELRPDNAEAYAGLGATFFIAKEDPQEGIDALERARRQLPSRMDIVFDLMQLYPRVGRRAEAQRLMDEIFSRHATPEQIVMARDMLLRADMMRAERMREEGRHEEALALLDSLRVADATPQIQAALEARIAKTELWLQQRDESDARNRRIALYNDAVDKARDNDLEGAVAILEPLVTEIENEELSAQARDTLLQMRLMQAERMMEEGRHEEGIAALESLRGATTDEKMRSAIEAQIARTRAWLKERDEAEAHNRQVDLYNEAVRRANGGDLEGALAILDGLVPELRDPELRRQAGDLQRRLREALGR